MSREVQSVLVLLLGGALLRITLASEVYLRYVKAGLHWPLVAAGALLVCAAVVTLLRDTFGPAALAADDDDHPEHGHGHGHAGPLIAWLLVLPVFAIMLVGPPALGSYSVNRSGAAAAQRLSADYPPLPAGDPVRVSLLDYVSRALWAGGASLRGRDLRLTGFVTTGPLGRVYLTRIVITCCAADGQALRILLTGPVPDGLSPDTWVTVTGNYDGQRVKDPVSLEEVPTLSITRLNRVSTPAEPYDT